MVPPALLVSEDEEDSTADDEKDDHVSETPQIATFRPSREISPSATIKTSSEAPTRGEGRTISPSSRSSSNEDEALSQTITPTRPQRKNRATTPAGYRRRKIMTGVEMPDDPDERVHSRKVARRRARYHNMDSERKELLGPIKDIEQNEDDLDYSTDDEVDEYFENLEREDEAEDGDVNVDGGEEVQLDRSGLAKQGAASLANKRVTSFVRQRPPLKTRRMTSPKIIKKATAKENAASMRSSGTRERVNARSWVGKGNKPRYTPARKADQQKRRRKAGSKWCDSL